MPEFLWVDAQTYVNTACIVSVHGGLDDEYATLHLVNGEKVAVMRDAKDFVAFIRSGAKSPGELWKGLTDAAEAKRKAR